MARRGVHGPVIQPLIDRGRGQRVTHSGFGEVVGDDRRRIKLLLKVGCGNHRAVKRVLQLGPFHLVHHQVNTKAADRDDAEEDDHAQHGDRPAIICAELAKLCLDPRPNGCLTDAKVA